MCSKDMTIPYYWNLISAEDKEEYKELRKHLSSPLYKNRRNKSLEVFQNSIELVRNFVIKNDADDKNRALVAGIMFFEDCQAVNIHQLQTLLSKSKSSINGSYQALGYGTIPAGADSAVELIKMYPFFKNNFQELRMWTLRQKFPQEEEKLDLIIKSHVKKQNNDVHAYVTPPPDLFEPIDSEVQISNDDFDRNELELKSSPMQSYEFIDFSQDGEIFGKDFDL